MHIFQLFSILNKIFIHSSKIASNSKLTSVLFVFIFIHSCISWRMLLSCVFILSQFLQKTCRILSIQNVKPEVIKKNFKKTLYTYTILLLFLKMKTRWGILSNQTYYFQLITHRHITRILCYVYVVCKFRITILICKNSLPLTQKWRKV